MHHHNNKQNVLQFLTKWYYNNTCQTYHESNTNIAQSTVIPCKQEHCNSFVNIAGPIIWEITLKLHVEILSKGLMSKNKGTHPEASEWLASGWVPTLGSLSAYIYSKLLPLTTSNPFARQSTTPATLKLCTCKRIKKQPQSILLHQCNPYNIKYA